MIEDFVLNTVCILVRVTKYLRHLVIVYLPRCNLKARKTKLKVLKDVLWLASWHIHSWCCCGPQPSSPKAMAETMLTDAVRLWDHDLRALTQQMCPKLTSRMLCQVSISDKAEEKQLNQIPKTETKLHCRLGKFTRSEKGLPCKPGDVSLNSRAHSKERKKAGRSDTGVLLVISAPERQTGRWPDSPAKFASTRPVSSTRGTGCSELYTHAMLMCPHQHTKL